MNKRNINSIKRKNDIAWNILNTLQTRRGFLMIGHANPDEDCLSAMVAFALLVSKFQKEATIFLTGEVHEHFKYLVDICRHNSISVTDTIDPTYPAIDTVVVCDTPKPDMLDITDSIRELLNDDRVVTIELDHHLEADSAYIGDDDYALVTEASSACELVGYSALKLCSRPDILEAYDIHDLFSRNLVLSILTGIIGDSKMGKFLKSRRERRFYDIFSGMFNELLAKKTTNVRNFSNKEQVFDELGRLSEREEACFDFIVNRHAIAGPVGYVALDEEESKELFSSFDSDMIVSVSRSVADRLAEKTKRLSLVAFYDLRNTSGLIQFRVRRSHAFKKFDVRGILDRFSIENGGGHEGAIGFRFKKTEVSDFRKLVDDLVEGIRAELSEVST